MVSQYAASTIRHNDCPSLVWLGCQESRHGGFPFGFKLRGENEKHHGEHRWSVVCPLLHAVVRILQGLSLLLMWFQLKNMLCHVKPVVASLLFQNPLAASQASWLYCNPLSAVSVLATHTHTHTHHIFFWGGISLTVGTA